MFPSEIEDPLRVNLLSPYDCDERSQRVERTRRAYVQAIQTISPLFHYTLCIFFHDENI